MKDPAGLAVEAVAGFMSSGCVGGANTQTQAHPVGVLRDREECRFGAWRAAAQLDGHVDTDETIGETNPVTASSMPAMSGNSSWKTSGTDSE